ncbi:phasin family protein [Curvivirga sp.]|uniref:phasin family protein n=1 Tax=Curvivirga sp. TaxID=2856848 RepID=UPI003B59FA8D
MTNTNPFMDLKNNPFFDPKNNPFLNPENNPFSGKEFTKMFEKFDAKAFDLPELKLEEIFAAQQKNFEAVAAANKAAVEGVQAIFAKQADTLNKVIEESKDVISEMTAAGEPQDKIAKQADLTKEALEKSVATMREIAELIASSQSEAFDILNTRLNAQLDEFKSVVKKPAAPAKSKKAVA